MLISIADGMLEGADAINIEYELGSRKEQAWLVISHYGKTEAFWKV